MNNVGEAAVSSRVGVISGLWQNNKVRIALQVLFLLGMSGLAAWGKSISPGLGIPGSSGILWLTPLVIGRMSVQKRGAGIFLGVTTALWGVPFGIHNALFYNMFLYGIAGLALDLAAVLPFVNIRNPFGAIFCGIIAHLGKFLFINEAAMLTGVTKNFILFGLAWSAMTHIAFGAAAGVAAWLVYRAVKLAREKQHKA